MMDLLEIAGAVGGTVVGGEPAGRAASSFVVDSRQVEPGALFFAFRGQKQDGHSHISDAAARGAVAAVVERVPEDGDLAAREFPLIIVPDSLAALQKLARYWRDKLGLAVVAITGSVGKTTTKEVIGGVLSRRFRVLKTEGNLNTEIGMPLTLLRARPEHEVMVVEMGMYALGEIRALARLARPNLGVITNVGPTHLERLGSIERIAEAKSELVQELGADGIAVLNFDDERVRGMASRTAAKTSFFGLDVRADFWAGNVLSQGLGGIDFDLHHEAERVHVRTLLLGVHSVHATLAAAAVAHNLGMSLEEIAAGLHEISPALRLIVEEGVNGSTIVDDSYNASPASTLAALNLLADLDGRKVAVLGDMLELGPYTEEGHRMVGRRAADVADILVVVGELAAIVGHEAIASGKNAGSVVFAESNNAAVERLLELLGPGDCVLVKGSRGMRMEEIVEGIRCHTP
ncbi:MAG TPA: UDP-N-acetylmuramoyl-tripeptide--D-alanyl-D-alanine ligase [Chloroflexota bacterium]